MKTFIHPNYTGNVRDGADIALLRLERPSKLQVPRLPSPETTLKDGDTFITLGWGRTTTNGPLPNALQEASGLIFVPNENCNYQDVWNGLIKNDMICAGGIGGDACKGTGHRFLKHPKILINKAERSCTLRARPTDINIALLPSALHICQKQTGCLF